MKIAEFQGEYRWLSNFWWVGDTTVEHQYQAAKYLNADQAGIILDCPTPAKAKRLSRLMTNWRPDWEQVKVDIMLNLLRWKFSQPDLKEKLLATGDALLEEGNTWGDAFWGVCPPNSGNGYNWLGRLIMQVRDELRKTA